MNITIMYPQMLNTGRNSETIENISNFQEKSYGISFNYDKGYVFFPYTHIMSFFLTEENNNDS